MELPYDVEFSVKAKFYLTCVAASIRSGVGFRSRNLGWKQSVFLAVILAHAKNRDQMRNYLSVEEARPFLSHLARHTFLIGQKAKCTLDVVGKDLQVNIKKRKIEYCFNIIAVPDTSRAAFIHDLTPLSEIFFLEIYDLYKYQGGTVLDIGGYIGDTAVYFAKNGAKEVYSYEPNPINFAYLTKNVEMNGVSRIVTAFNCAVSMERRALQVPNMGGAGSVFAAKSGLSSYDIDNIRPTEILKDRSGVALLKVDCKGCEVELFKAALDEVGAKATHIIIDAGRLNSEQKSEMILNLEHKGFVLDSGPGDVVYLRKS